MYLSIQYFSSENLSNSYRGKIFFLLFRSFRLRIFIIHTLTVNIQCKMIISDLKNHCDKKFIILSDSDCKRKKWTILMHYTQFG